MLNYQIYSHLELATHAYTTIGGKRWTPVCDTAVNYLPPSGSGYDLEYGTGAYVLTSCNTVTGDYVLTAFRPGMTYGGITTAHGFFYQPVRDSVTDQNLGGLGSSPENHVTYKPWLNTATTANMYLTEFVDNNLEYQVPVNYYFSVTYQIYAGSAWSSPASTVTSTYAVTLPTGGTNLALSAPLTLTVPSNWAWIRIETDFHLTYNWYLNSSQQLAHSIVQAGVVHGGSYLPGAGPISIWDSNERVPWTAVPLYYPTYPYEVIQNAGRIPQSADVAGAGTIVSPYQGSDYKANIVDITLCTTPGVWLSSPSWTGIYNPADKQHRADINNDGKVNIVDVSWIAAPGHWLSSWAAGTPPP